jgi:hypothetical protein
MEPLVFPGNETRPQPAPMVMVSAIDEAFFQSKNLWFEDHT